MSDARVVDANVIFVRNLSCSGFNSIRGTTKSNGVAKAAVVMLLSMKTESVVGKVLSSSISGEYAFIGINGDNYSVLAIDPDKKTNGVIAVDIVPEVAR